LRVKVKQLPSQVVDIFKAEIILPSDQSKSIIEMNLKNEDFFYYTMRDGKKVKAKEDMKKFIDKIHKALQAFQKNMNKDK
jgi:hypothetical protein